MSKSLLLALFLTQVLFSFSAGLPFGRGRPHRKHVDQFIVSTKRHSTTQTDAIDQIVQHLVHGRGKGDTYSKLSLLADVFGSRLVTSPNFEPAADFLVDQLGKIVGPENVYTELVTVTNWTRGSDNWAVLLTPQRMQELPILAFGYSVGTPSGKPIMAKVIVVKSFDELNSLDRSSTEGKIVVFNEPWLGSYAATVEYRERGAIEAAKKGAVAALVRSVTPFSLATLHGGMMDEASIPGAAITIEDAELLQRLQDRGMETMIMFQLTCQASGTIESRNIIAEIKGSTLPNEVVLFGGHFDSWDVGTGAMDDGGGVAISWQVLETVKTLKLAPKRTLRAVFWTAEEFGHVGGKAYYAAHRNEAEKISLVMESDSGTFRPLGYNFKGSTAAKESLQSILNQLQSINALTVSDGEGPGDPQGFVANSGVPGVELATEAKTYMYYHHSPADTMTAMNSTNLDLCSAVFAATAFGVADMDDLLPRTHN